MLAVRNHTGNIVVAILCFQNNTKKITSLLGEHLLYAKYTSGPAKETHQFAARLKFEA